MRILALDPGGTTGVATFIDGEWERWELGGQHHDELLTLIDFGMWDVVIYERFQYQRRELDKGVSLVLDSVEYIGVIKLAHQRAGFQTPFVLKEQTPAQAKNLWDDAKLKKLVLWCSSPHERDATRHLLYYLVIHLGQREWIDRLK